jgi:hypothetical protein
MAADQQKIAMLGLGIMAAAEVPNFLAGMLPSTMTIGRFAAEPADRLRLRRGEVVGGALSVSVGIAASLIGESPMPFLLTMVVLAVLIYEYERAIRLAQAEGTAQPINAQ